MSRLAPYVELSAVASAVASAKGKATYRARLRGEGNDRAMNISIATVLASAKPYVSAPPSSPHLLAHDTPNPFETQEGRRRGPHPGDILFWVACVGGVGLLLLASTT